MGYNATEHLTLPCLTSILVYRVTSQCHIDLLRYLNSWTMHRGRLKNAYELLNLRALKFSPVNKIHIFNCMSKIICVKFQRVPLKLHTKYLAYTLKDTIFIGYWNLRARRFKSSCTFLKRRFWHRQITITINEWFDPRYWFSLIQC